MTVWLGGALALASTPALAQDAPPPTAARQAPSDAIGPAELQNFSLKGSLTKPAEQTAPAPAPEPSAQAAPARTSAVAPKTERRSAEARLAPPSSAPAPKVSRDTQVAQSSAPSPSPASAHPTPGSIPAPTLDQPSIAAPSLPGPPAAPLAPGHPLSIVPWLLAALALAAGTFFLLWRRRPREAFAGGPQVDLFVPPEPAPSPPPAPAPRATAPQPAPEPPKPTPPAAKGVVATRLRPQVEIAVQPLSCQVDGEQVTLEFELELFNAGAAPARAVLAETALFNAGAAQDQQLAAFFASPVGSGERLDAIPPMKRVTFASRVVAPRSAIQEYELAGRKTIVPVLAFNALYEWSGGHAQTSAAYLVGRETKSDKLGPLGVNGAPREFRGLAAHVLPAALRT